MHDAFFSVGVDVVETATFGAFAIPLAEYDIADKSHEINLAAARIAREVADGHATNDRPRFVAGSMGPGTKFASLGQITFAKLRDAYEVQARGLLEGGVDLLLVETQFDLLGAKAGIVGCRRAMAQVGREVPIQAQVTMELTGTMLPGTEIGAALAALDAVRPDVIGINCATGPAEMSEHLRYLSQHARMPISCLPNAGLPSVVDGKMHYDLTPEQLVEHQSRFVTEYGVQVVGGCCGTTVEHISQLVTAMARAHPEAARAAARARRDLDLQLHALRPGPDATCRSASAPTPTAPRSSARPCWTPTGTRACRWHASRSGRAPTCSTCASTTSGATAPRTWPRSRPASPPRPRSR